MSISLKFCHLFPPGYFACTVNISWPFDYDGITLSVFTWKTLLPVIFKLCIHNNSINLDLIRSEVYTRNGIVLCFTSIYRCTSCYLVLVFPKAKEKNL